MHHLLVKHLRRSHSLRHGKRHTRKGEKGSINIVNGISIHERSKHIDNRRSFGHWEGDLVSGTNNSHIATLVDRKSRYTVILKLNGKVILPTASRDIPARVGCLYTEQYAE